MYQFFYLYFISALCFLTPFVAFSRVQIDMGKAYIRESQMAIQPLILSGEGSQHAIKTGTIIFKTLEQNLSSSGYFKLISQQSFLEKPGEKALEAFPAHLNGFRWKNWRILKTDYLLLGKFFLKKNKIYLNMYLYNISLKRKIFQKEYITHSKMAEKLAHIICNDIVQVLTNKPGIFLTKILAVRNMKQNIKELFSMDWTGKNHKQLSFHRSIVLSPFWSNTGRHIVYTAFLYRKSLHRRSGSLVLYNRANQARKLISKTMGTYLGSYFLPDGKHILISLFLKKGNRDIAKMSVINGTIEPLTFGPNGAINVEAVEHPQKKNIVFSSDRGGNVMLYSMDNTGKNIKILTSVGKYNSMPQFSPDGKKIVFSGYSNKRFDIFIMNSDGSDLHRLTSAKKINNIKWANHESPSFSPDGRYIVFTSNRMGNYQLYIMNLLSKDIIQITKDKYNYHHPRWSPLLK